MRLRFSPLIVCSLLMLFSCSSNEDGVQPEIKQVNEEFNALTSLEAEIFNEALAAKKQNFVLVRGQKLLNLSVSYMNDHPADSLLERVYEMAALGAESCGKYDDAINYLYLAQRNFPTSKRAPIYLFNRARILDDVLNKKDESILAYNELVELYPDDSLSISMKAYVNSTLMNKSEAELLEFFNSKNQ